jgi:hypothetical protein
VAEPVSSTGSDKVTIAADKKRGSVIGTDFDGDAIVASFTC